MQKKVKQNTTYAIPAINSNVPRYEITVKQKFQFAQIKYWSPKLVRNYKGETLKMNCK
jgi:hypothetical protein